MRGIGRGVSGAVQWLPVVAAVGIVGAIVVGWQTFVLGMFDPAGSLYDHMARDLAFIFAGLTWVMAIVTAVRVRSVITDRAGKPQTKGGGKPRLGQRVLTVTLMVLWVAWSPITILVAFLAIGWAPGWWGPLVAALVIPAVVFDVSRRVASFHGVSVKTGELVRVIGEGWKWPPQVAAFWPLVGILVGARVWGWRLWFEAPASHAPQSWTALIGWPLLLALTLGAAWAAQVLGTTQAKVMAKLAAAFGVDRAVVDAEHGWVDRDGAIHLTDLTDQKMIDRLDRLPEGVDKHLEDYEVLVATQGEVIVALMTEETKAARELARTTEGLVLSWDDVPAHERI